MALFMTAYLLLMQHEGGYSWSKTDKGGETYKGISRKYNPNWEGWVVIDGAKTDPTFPKNLDSVFVLNDYVQSFYQVQWNLSKCGQFESQELANAFFDAWVNQGDDWASRSLQTIVGVFPDGVMGQQTVQAVNWRDQNALLIDLKNVREIRYKQIAFADPTQEANLTGWLSRLA